MKAYEWRTFGSLSLFLNDWKLFVDCESSCCVCDGSWSSVRAPILHLQSCSPGQGVPCLRCQNHHFKLCKPTPTHAQVYMNVRICFGCFFSSEIKTSRKCCFGCVKGRHMFRFRKNLTVFTNAYLIRLKSSGLDM